MRSHPPGRIYERTDMMDFIVNNLGTIVVIAILAVIVFFAVRSIVKDKKNGKSSSCGGNCAGCAMGGSCHGK